jgi:hypothetical protein
LFEFVRFEFLTNKKISECVDFLGSKLDLMNEPIWKAFCKRVLVCPCLRNQKKSGRHREVPVPAPDSEPNPEPDSVPDQGNSIERFPFLYGIVQSIKWEYGEHWGDFLRLSASSCYPLVNTYQPLFATDVSTKTGFASTNQTDSWLEYEFVRAIIRPTHYAVRSWFPNCIHTQWPIKWKLEGWNGSEHFVLDDWTNKENGVLPDQFAKAENRTEHHLLRDHLVVTFPIAEPKWISRVRFTQIGPNRYAASSFCLILSYLEFFGDIEVL